MTTTTGRILVATAALLGFSFTPSGMNPDQNPKLMDKTVVLKSADNLSLKADVYESDRKDAPVILLFHQAGYSRGEYRPIAPKLCKLGFTCIAIDQRSGKGVNGVENEAFKEAQSLKLGTTYTDALPDLETALRYAQKEYPSRRILVWGSSYSAALSIVMGSRYPDAISAIVLFSPGEYFKYNEKEITEYAKSIRCPIFITSAKDEYDQWKAIFEAIPSTDKHRFIPSANGVHGSKALWDANSNSKEYWNAVTNFLARFTK